MFGYVTPLKPELKIKDFNKFQAYYCGLCHHIKKRYGNPPRLALNYDMTFLGILLDSLTEEKTKFKPIKCLAHPFKKKAISYENKALDYASSINIILFYYKLLDDVLDERSIKGKLGALILSPSKKKFSKEFDDLAIKIKFHLNNLNILEKEKNFSSIDEISHPFAELTGLIFKSYPEKLKDESIKKRELLYWLGYNLGRWIYLIDAFDDLEKDMECSKFNPINYLFNEENLSFKDLYNKIKPKIEFILLNCSFTCHELFNQLEVHENQELLHNILHLGLMHKNSLILNKCNVGNICEKTKKGVIANESI